MPISEQPETGRFEHDPEVSRHGCILFLEDEIAPRATWTVCFTEAGWDVYAYATVEDAIRRLDEDSCWEEIDIAVLDYNLKGSANNGLEFATTVQEKSEKRIQAVMLTGEAPFISHRETLRQGQGDRIVEFFTKDQREELLAALFRLQEIADLRRENLELRRKQAAMAWQGFSNVLGEALQDTDERVVRYIGPSLMSVLILGETGTGKEEMARRIHVASRLPGTDAAELSERFRCFRVLNCAGLSDDLLMSHLFGHVEGSYTGAISHQLGAILEAAGLRHFEYDPKDREPFEKWLLRCVKTGLGKERICPSDMEVDEHGYIAFPAFESRAPQGCCGTLFLDEVADLSPYAQAALLRFLDGNEIQPLGYFGTPIRPKIRVIAATNRSELLFGEDDKGFRPDLLWRLMEWVIKMPPIRARGAEPIEVACSESGKLATGTPGTRHMKGIEMRGDALLSLKKMIEGGGDDEGRFGGRTPTTSGNYRSLKALIRRATWMAATAENADVCPFITREILEEAASDYIDLTQQSEGAEATNTAKERVEAGTVQERKQAVIEAAQYLGESDRVHEPHKFTADDGNLDGDIELTKNLRDLLSHTGHGVHQKHLFHNPGRELEADFAVLSDHRWKYVCVLAMFGASHARARDSAYRWETLSGVVFGEEFSRDALKLQYLPALLTPYRIETKWGSKSSSGPAGGFVQLFFQHRDQIGAHAEFAGFGSVKKNTVGPRFFWEESVSAEQKEDAYAFLSHLASVADAIGLSKPWLD